MLLVQDAVPASPAWLQALVAPLLQDDHVAGSFARQCPAPGASRLTIEYLSRWIAAQPEPRIVGPLTPGQYEAMLPSERLIACAFDNVCACIRLQVWRSHPFRRTSIAEDLEWAREVLLAGYKLAYAADAVVSHSHERPVTYELQRTYLVHQRLHALFGLTTIPSLPALLRSIAVTVPANRPPCGQGTDGTPSRLHSQCRARGSGAGWSVSRCALVPRRSRMAADGAHLMRVMLVVHGFPPAAHGGTEVYVHDLAVALAALPHTEVAVLTRHADSSRPELELRRRPCRKCVGLQHQQHVPALCAISRRVTATRSCCASRLARSMSLRRTWCTFST